MRPRGTKGCLLCAWSGRVPERARRGEIRDREVGRSRRRPRRGARRRRRAPSATASRSKKTSRTAGAASPRASSGRKPRSSPTRASKKRPPRRPPRARRYARGPRRRRRTSRTSSGASRNRSARPSSSGSASKPPRIERRRCTGPGRRRSDASARCATPSATPSSVARRSSETRGNCSRTPCGKRSTSRAWRATTRTRRLPNRRRARFAGSDGSVRARRGPR